ncbi:MAG: hypothetical protein ACRDAS_07095, partial [Cetobacterium sp.]
FIFSNRAKFTIGTGGYSNSKGTVLGFSSLKPKKNIITISSQFVTGSGSIGSLTIEFKTTGEIIILSDGGTAPGYINHTNSSYYASFDFDFV